MTNENLKLLEQEQQRETRRVLAIVGGIGVAATGAVFHGALNDNIYEMGGAITGGIVLMASVGAYLATKAERNWHS